MNITHIRIDPTTNSNVFNPLSSRGQWLCHMFGKRNISFNADYNTLLGFLENFDDLQTVDLYSEFGDVACWKHLKEFVTALTSKNIHCVINTYGSTKSLSHLSKYNVTVVFHVDGINEQSGKVFLNSHWPTIKNNIIAFGNNAIVKFAVFKHNVYQTVDIVQFCNQVNCEIYATEEWLSNKESVSIIDENKKWLYDVHSRHSDLPTLVQTVQCWNLLKTKTKIVEGTPIDKAKNLPLNFNFTALDDDDLVNITLKGHMFVGSKKSQIFSNALCNDWGHNSLDLTDEYTRSAYAELYRFSRIELDNFNIYKSAASKVIESATTL